MRHDTKRWERHTLQRELGALVEETETLAARAGADEVAESTGEDALVNVGGVTGVGGLVAAGELGLVTALLGGLLDGDVVGDREADLAVALAVVVGEVAVGVAVADGRGQSSDGGSEGHDSSGDGELHCV